MPAPAQNLERRRHPRYTLGLPVRLQAEGQTEATTIELSDVSFRGCRLGAFIETVPPDIDTRVAFGFVVPGRRIALARGRVVRHVAGRDGFGVGLSIERANAAFYEFMLKLSEKMGELKLTSS